MKGRKFRAKKVLSLLMCLSLAAATCITSVGAMSTEPHPNSFVEKMNGLFQNPVMEYRPEIRWWLAEGSHTDETLKESIQELYQDGYGAIEFVTLDESSYLDNATYAWGSEEWVHDSHLIVEECTKLGMGVSFTSGTHWSTANLTTITPDDPAASQELGYRTVNLTAGQQFSGVLPTPELTANATKMRLVEVVTAKKTSVSEDGKTIRLGPDSLTDITDTAVQQLDGTWTIDYTAPIDGDYILFSFWQYGTSETYKPASTGEAYTINYFSREGADALIEYWNENVLTPDLQQMIQENGDVSLYMDSLELSTRGTNSTGNLWCDDYEKEFSSRRGYDVGKYLPIFTLQSNVTFMSEPLYSYTLEGEEDLCNKLRNDLYQTNTELYMEECLDVLTEWLHRFGMTLRAENSYGYFFEISQPVKSLDYVETESLEFNTEPDMYRSQGGAAHLYGKTYSSETGALGGENYYRNHEYYRQIFYTQFAAGIQRTVLHGYSSAYGPEQNCSWPGYEGMMPFFSERFSKRQPASLDYPEINQHLARIQTALRQGTVKMDLGILRNDYYINNASEFQRPFEENYLHNHKAFYWQDMTLQDAGYTYDYFSPMLLQDNEITCTNGQIQADGVGYQGLIVYQEELPYESAQVLYQWAKDGLPVVIIDGETQEEIRNNMIKVNTSAAIQTPFNDGKDEQLIQLMDQIKQLDNVAVVNQAKDTYEALMQLGIRPRAEYVESNDSLLNVLHQAEDASYLYVYNYMYEEEQNDIGQISLDGIYKPYALNTWTGEITELAEYSYQGSRTILNVDLAPGDIMVFVLDPNDQGEKTVVSSENVDKVTVENGNTTMYVANSGKAVLNYSDGTSYTEEVSVPEDIQLDNWNLVVQDWQPGDKITRTEDRGFGYTTTEVTYDTNKVDINVGQTDLIPWKDIPQVGGTVSGVGSYTTTFTLPENWDNSLYSLQFQADSFSGGTAAIFINGKQVNGNMDNCTADLSEFAQPGENTIEVRVTSSLRNRMYDLGYDVNWTMWHQTPEIDSYGMVGDTTLKVYTKVVGQSTDQPSSDNPESPSTNESTNSPQTGDAAPIIGITVLTMASATMLIFRKKK
ncbi:glycosyl hydrolase [Massilioclostridium coli]|uniref:glycosyl hydrolase n=1 Tax=Massilioclostridium coli TaxID=1870991 RepID=UPI0022E52704|nr:glycosyl hydrolase [Massilioclostridium coli]